MTMHGAGWFGPGWFSAGWFGTGTGAVPSDPYIIPPPERRLIEIEVWTSFEAAGGVPLAQGRFIGPWVSRLEEERALSGDEWLDLAVAKDSPAAGSLTRGRVVRLVPESGQPEEWEIERVSVQSGSDDLLVVARCVGVRRRLLGAPITQEDGDGFVYRSVPAVQLAPATILSNVVLAAAPSWIVAGTVTPTDVEEIQFDGDNALSGASKLADLTATELRFRRVDGTEYLVDLVEVGSDAAPWVIRSGRNLRSLRREVGAGDQVTRITGVGAEGDEGPSTLAWAYWNTAAPSGGAIVLSSIHGGPGPIQFDDQLNGLYLENAQTGTRREITDSVASTQSVSLDTSGYAAGHWVRVVASSAGRHLVSLDAPAEIAAEGGRVRPGEHVSPWDDTVNILANGTARAMPSPTAAPTGWTIGSGTISQITTAGQWLTAGHSAQVSGTIAGGSAFLTASRTWVVSARRATWSATCWVRVLALPVGAPLAFRITRNGSPIGEALTYISPLNTWVQLKIEGLVMPTGSATLGVALYNEGNTGTVTVQVDSIQLSPSYTARPILEGSGAARIWQQANRALDEGRAVPVSYAVTAADLARAGEDAPPFVLGAWGTVRDEELGESVPARIVRLRRDRLREVDTALTLSTDPRRLRDRLTGPRPLVVPFFEPVRNLAAQRDARTTALFIKATVISVTENQITVLVTAADSLGGTPTITQEVFGATLFSTIGAQYVYDRPEPWAGVGRAVFTASLAGRSNVIDAVDIPEQDGSACIVDIQPVTVNATQVQVRVYVAAPRGAATATINYTSLGASVSPATGQTLSATDDLTTTNYVTFTITRAAFGTTPGVIAFTATVPGHLPATQTIEVESVADLASATKVVHIDMSALKEMGEYTSDIESSGDGALQSAAGTVQALEYRRAALDMIPEGATITNFSAEAYGYGIPPNSTVMISMYKGNFTAVGSTMQAADATSWSSLSQSLSEVVAANTRYMILVQFLGDSGGGGGTTVGHRRIRKLSVSYTSPNLQATR